MDRTTEQEYERQLRAHQRTTAKAERRALAAEAAADRAANALRRFMVVHDNYPEPRRCKCDLCEQARAAIQACAAPTSAEPLFYVQCTSRSRDCAVWWGPNGNGYTCDLSKAGLYPEVGEWADDCVLWPREVVERMAVRHVRTEALAAGERAEVTHG